MSDYEEKNNPPLWFLILGIIIMSVVAVYIMLAPSNKYTQKNQYYLKDAQGQVINKLSKSPGTGYRFKPDEFYSS